MATLKIAAAVALALLSAGAKAESIFCAEQILEEQPNNEWRIQYSGSLTHVTLTKYYSSKAPQSVITCYREYGVVARNTTKSCHLVQGEGQTVLVLETETKETFRCSFRPDSFKDNNDTACNVLCE